MDNLFTSAYYGPDRPDSFANPLAAGGQSEAFAAGEHQAPATGGQVPPSAGRLLFMPSRQAFRVGGASPGFWNQENIGAYSFASGYNTVASSEGSFAAGHGSLARGLYAVALGLDTQATGVFAMAAGAFNKAAGAASFVAGANNTASGEYACAFGRGTVATDRAEFVLGQYNTIPTAVPLGGLSCLPASPGSPTPVGPDIEEVGGSKAPSLPPAAGPRALVVGIGQHDKARADGFTVFQDGTVGLHNLSAPPQQTGGRFYMVAGNLYFGSTLLSTGSNPGGRRLQVVTREEDEHKADEVVLVPRHGEKHAPGICRLVVRRTPDALHFGEAEANQAYGKYSVGLGKRPVASGNFAVAVGEQPKATGHQSFALGARAEAGGQGAYALGMWAQATGDYAYALGIDAEATAEHAFAAGNKAKATKEHAIALGQGAEATNFGACAIGPNSYASGQDSIALGRTRATSDSAVAMGRGAKATGPAACAIGQETNAEAYATLAVGAFSSATMPHAVAMGLSSKATGEYAFAVGNKSVATSEGAVAMGLAAQATGNYSFAAGNKSVAAGEGAVAFGSVTQASGTCAFAIGEKSTASGKAAVALGHECEASGPGAFAVGYGAVASSTCSVALGNNAHASGAHAVAIGHTTKALGEHSLAAGLATVASNEGEIAVGRYNVENIEDRLFSIGNGRKELRHDALQVFRDGMVRIISPSTPLRQQKRVSAVNGLASAQLEIIGQEGHDGVTICNGDRQNSLNIVKRDDDYFDGTFISFGFKNKGDNDKWWQAGAIKADGANKVEFLTSSDARLKDDRGLLAGSLGLVSRIRIHDFTWKSDGQPDVGVFAQELHEVFPAAVDKGDDGPEVQQRWMVDYSKLQPLAIAAVQELHQTVARQQQQIDELRQQVAELLRR